MLPAVPAAVELGPSIVCYLFSIYQALLLKPLLSFDVLALSKPFKEILKEICNPYWMTASVVARGGRSVASPPPFNRLQNRTQPKRGSCSKSATALLLCCHQADIRMRSHRLLRLDENKSAANCQQAWCKMIIETFYPQAWCKLHQVCKYQVETSLIFTDLLQVDEFNRLAATFDNLLEAGKIYNLQKVCGVSGCVQPELQKSCGHAGITREKDLLYVRSVRKV